MKKVLKLTALILILCSACYYDNEEYLYPSIDSSCDTTNVTFSVTISGIMNDYCWSCHSNSTAANFGNNIRLENYSDVKSQSQKVLGAISHESGFSPMPKGSAKLNDCLITQFGIWVDHGTPDN
jgi:hypothetical protein